MRNSPYTISNVIASFLGLGIFIALLICAIIFFSYVFVIGAIIGLILFIVAFVRSKIHKQKNPHTIHQNRQGHRTIDQKKDQD